jgi:magnesium-protoporphyrin O-methyltransferase
MACCCSGSAFCGAVEGHFTRARAAAELDNYRRKGPPQTTRLLCEGVTQAGCAGGTLLDIGSGIGALGFELLQRGITQAAGVDASPAYVAAAQQEAARRGHVAATRFVHGDFLQLTNELPSATVVTLDRVVCCYPLYEPLLAEALRHAERCLALSYPRGRWYVRAGLATENFGRRMRKNPFRAFVHSPAAMEQVIRAAGFQLTSRRNTFAWCVDVYLKKGQAVAAAFQEGS